MLINYRKQQGVGLIEVLISMLVLGIGVLGIISVQSRSVQFTQGAFYKSRASVLASDMMDRIRSNPTQASRYRIGLNDSIPSFTSCDGPSANCSVAQLADFDVASWRNEIATTIPDGLGQIEEIAGAGGASIFVITVQYQDGRLEDANADAQNSDTETAPKQITFRTRL